MKSELHLNQDGVRTGDRDGHAAGRRAGPPDIGEVQPKLVITVGTAGATFADHGLGDVVITRGAKFRLREEFANEPFADKPRTTSH